MYVCTSSETTVAGAVVVATSSTTASSPDSLLHSIRMDDGMVEQKYTKMSVHLYLVR